MIFLAKTNIPSREVLMSGLEIFLYNGYVAQGAKAVRIIISYTNYINRVIWSKYC
jgi:hypothetical protein